ncbi:hypothetical protein JK356_12660 [Streptomyces sp. 7-21]|nr:hypothetical protein [Streptomyces sp. 7-21]
MPSYEELSSLNLEKLDTAVSDWRSTADGFRDLAEQARTGLRDKAESADWSGENADASKRYVLFVADKFQYAHEEASGIHGILQDLTDALRSCKERLVTLREEIRGTGLTIQPDGTVIVAPPSPMSPDAVGLDLPGNERRPPERLEEIESYEEQIRAILAEAAEWDGSAARALTSMAGAANVPFTEGAWSDLDEARAEYGRRDAREVLSTLQRDPSEISDASLEEVIRFFDANRYNEEFATYLASELGAEGTLEAWSGLLDPWQAQDASEGRAQLLEEFRMGFGSTLALATQSDAPGMDTWKDEMIALGDQQFGVERSDYSPYGFQLMSSLMGDANGKPTGVFDTDFLTDYGEALLEFEQGMNTPGREWATAYSDHRLPTGLGDGAFQIDPMTGYMGALSHNPEAAANVFHEKDTMEYLLNRTNDDVPALRAETPDGEIASLKATGNALFAATTGMDINDLSLPQVEGDGDWVDRRDMALELLAEQENDFPAEFREPVAGMLVHHGEDFVSTMIEGVSDQPMDVDDLYDVTTQISRSSESFGLLNEGMNYYLTDVIRDDSRAPQDTLIQAGTTIGFLEEARLDALDIELEEGNEGAEDAATLLSYAAGTATSFIPGAGGLGAAASGLAADVIINAWLEDEQRTIEDNLERHRGYLAQNRRSQIEAYKNLWLAENREWAEQSEGYATDIQVITQLETYINNGRLV